MKNNEHGFIGNALLIAAAVVGTVTLVVEQRQQTLNQQISLAEKDRSRESTKIAAINSAARYKALLTEKKLPDGSYTPAIFAVDYFADNWTLKSNVNSSAFNLANSGDVKISSNAAIKNEIEIAQKVFSDGASAESLMKDNFNLRIIDTIRATSGDGKGVLVKSVDVEVALAQDSSADKVRVRVPVPIPVPYNAKVLFRPKGSSAAFQELTSGTQLSSGQFELTAKASGILRGIKLWINDGTPYLLGYNEDGDIFHNAKSYDSKNIQMPTIIDVDMEDEQSFDGRHEVCKAQFTDKSFKIQIAMMTVDGQELKQDAIYMNTADSKYQNGIDDGLTLEDYENYCSAEGQCPYLGGDPKSLNAMQYYWIDLHNKEPIDDISSAWSWDQANRYGISDRKLCSRMPDASTDTDHDWFHLTTFITYSIPLCQPRFLTERSACGCLAEDTLITLGDGKSQKRIDQLVQSDKIWNPITKKAVSMRRITRGPEKIPMLKVVAGGQELKVTGNHPFPTKDGMKTAFMLVEGQEILVGDSWKRIDSIVSQDAGMEPPVVWNIEIDARGQNWDDHHYMANGVVTGDLLIQEQLESAKRTASN